MCSSTVEGLFTIVILLTQQDENYNSQLTYSQNANLHHLKWTFLSFVKENNVYKVKFEEKSTEKWEFVDSRQLLQ